MLEFAFVLPIFMFMIMFSLDMGHLVLMSGAMQDATFSAARTGAQIGGAAIDATPPGNTVCGGRDANGQSCQYGSTWGSLQDTVAQIPHFGGAAKLVDMHILHGAICLNDNVNDHVAIRTTYTVPVITPGLRNMLAMFSGGRESSVPTGDWALSATAVARCEVVRSTSTAGP